MTYSRHGVILELFPVLCKCPQVILAGQWPGLQGRQGGTGGDRVGQGGTGWHGVSHLENEAQICPSNWRVLPDICRKSDTDLVCVISRVVKRMLVMFHYLT